MKNATPLTTMKNIILLTALSSIFAACDTSTKIIHSWRDPEVAIDTMKARKFVFAALIKNDNIRKRTEDLMTIYFPKKAIPSYKELSTDTLKESISFYNDQLKNRGFDAVVVLRLVHIDKTHPYVHGIYPAYYNNWKDFYNYAWHSYYNPGTYVIEKTYYVEVNVYSLLRDKLVWSGTTSTYNPSGSDALFDNVITTISEKMKKEGFLQ